MSDYQNIETVRKLAANVADNQNISEKRARDAVLRELLATFDQHGPPTFDVGPVSANADPVSTPDDVDVGTGVLTDAGAEQRANADDDGTADTADDVDFGTGVLTE